MPEPVYVVVGHARSLTTMVMGAAAAGGMTPIYTRRRARRLHLSWGRQVNAGALGELAYCPACQHARSLVASGVLEYAPDCTRWPAWLERLSCRHDWLHWQPCRTMLERHPERYRGCVLKHVIGSQRPGRFPEIETDALFLVRDWEEIEQSYEAAFCAPRTPLLAPALVRGDAVLYDRLMREAFERWPSARKQMVWARDLADPCFGRRVAAWESIGWPLDARRAAHACDPDRIRFRVEHLTPGIASRHVRVEDVA